MEGSDVEFSILLKLFRGWVMLNLIKVVVVEILEKKRGKNKSNFRRENWLRGFGEKWNYLLIGILYFLLLNCYVVVRIGLIVFLLFLIV